MRAGTRVRSAPGNRVGEGEGSASETPIEDGVPSALTAHDGSKVERTSAEPTSVAGVQSGSSGSRASALWAAIVAVVTFVFQLPFFDRWFSSMDEGHVLLFADIVAKGGELYRDATLYPLPGAFYMLAQAFHVFGVSVLVSRWIVVVEFSLFVALVFLLVRRVVSPRYAALCVGLLLLYRIWTFPHWHIYSYSTTSLLFFVTCMLCLAYFFENRKRWLLLLAGLLFGLCVYCKQDYGAAGLVAVCISLAVFARSSSEGENESLLRLAAGFLLPAATVGAGVGLYFFYHGLLGDLLQQAVFNHVRGIATYEYTTYPSILPLFSQDAEIRTMPGIFAYWPGVIFTVDLAALRGDFLYRETGVYDTLLKLFYWGPYLVVAWAALRMRRRRAALADPERRQAYLGELLLSAFAGAAVLMLTLNRPQDYLHLAVLYWPLLCLGVIYTEDLLHGRRALVLGLAVLLAVPAGAALYYSGRLAWRLRTVHSEPIPGERSGVYGTPAEVQLIEASVGFIRANAAPGETVAVIPYFPIVQFLADRPGPHRSSYIVWPHAEFEDRDRRIIDAMEAKGTDVVVYNFTQFLTFPLLQNFAPELFDYLVDHFDMQRVFTYDHAGYKLAGLLRGNEYERGEPLLDEVLPEVVVRVESEERPPRAIAPADRVTFVARQAWPFRRVLAQRPSSAGARSVLSLPVRASSGDVLHTAVGVNPQLWFDLPTYSVTFKLEAVSQGQRQLLYARQLKPHVILGDRGWFEVDIPLEEWVGRPLRLEFSTTTDSPAGEQLAMGGWAEPRVIRTGAGDD